MMMRLILVAAVAACAVHAADVVQQEPVPAPTKRECRLDCGTLVPHGWTGKDEGAYACKDCECNDGALTCSHLPRKCEGAVACAPRPCCRMAAHCPMSTQPVAESLCYPFSLLGLQCQKVTQCCDTIFCL